MMSSGAKLNSARKSDQAQPMGCAHWSPKRAPKRSDQTLQSKGFGGGVPQNSAYSGQHGGSLPFSFGVVADKKCTCPASKLMWERYPPTPPFHCGERDIQASLISSASRVRLPPPLPISGT